MIIPLHTGFWLQPLQEWETEARAQEMTAGISSRALPGSLTPARRCSEPANTLDSCPSEVGHPHCPEWGKPV